MRIKSPDGLGDPERSRVGWSLRIAVTGLVGRQLWLWRHMGFLSRLWKATKVGLVVIGLLCVLGIFLSH